MGHPRSALVTGGTGFLGSVVARRLIRAGIKTTVLCLAGRQRTRLQSFSHLELAEARDLSLPALEDVLSSVQPDLVLHLAAAGVCHGGDHIDQLLAINIDFTLNLIRAAASTCRPRIIHTGSCFEYAASPSAPLTERDLVAPFSMYGASKAASVQLGLALARHLDTPALVLRLFGVYGPSEASSRLVPTLIRNLTAYQPTQLTSGVQERDLLFEDDAAEAILAAAFKFDTLTNGAIYNVGSDAATSVREVGEWIASKLDRPQSLLRWGERPDRVGEPLRIVANSQAFRQATGWKPVHTLASGLGHTIAAMQAELKRSDLDRSDHLSSDQVGRAA